MVGTELIPASTSVVDTGLVYASGAPIIREVMEEKIAAATLMGVRQAVGTIVSAGIDPQTLATLLAEANDGDPLSLMQLAEEIEEKDLQYLAVLGQRKHQVAQLDVTLEAGSQQKADKKISAAVQDELIDTGLIEGALFDMLDALGKGFSLTEIIWDVQGSHWGIDELSWVDPRFIRFDRPTRRIPLLRADGDGGIGLPLPPYKFAWLQLKAKSGLPIRGGFIRPVAWAWLFKNFALKDWVQFCEIYGMPLRLGTFAPGASEADKDALLRAVSALSSDAAAIIPSNMNIIFPETKSGSGNSDVHGALTAYLDAQISKAVIGQTGTVDATPGKLGGQNDHTMVREDIERADARALSVCVNRDIVRPFVDLNWGPQDNYPYVQIGRPEPKNAALMVDTAAKLLPYGFKVRSADIRASVGFNEPEDGDELLIAPSAGSGAVPAPGNVPLSDLSYNLNTMRRAHLLAYELMAAEERDAIERAVAKNLGDTKELMGPLVQQILATAKTSGNFETFSKHLRGLNPDMTPLATRLASLMFQSYAGGAVGHEVETAPARALASTDRRVPRPYGDVEYGDPGWQSDRKPRYPLDTEEHIRAAWTYIHHVEDRAMYSAAQLDHIESKIVAAWKKKIDAAGPPSAQSDA